MSIAETARGDFRPSRLESPVRRRLPFRNRLEIPAVPRVEGAKSRARRPPLAARAYRGGMARPQFHCGRARRSRRDRREIRPIGAR